MGIGIRDRGVSARTDETGTAMQIIEKLARVICKGCEDDPDAPGDARGNEYRWQDYSEIATEVFATMLTWNYEETDNGQKKIT